MNKAFLLIGGNLGDREKNLETARGHIQNKCGRIERASSVYETKAWGVEDQPEFLNQVLIINTALSAIALMHEVLEIEQLMGRRRKNKYDARTIDIDILFFNNEQYALEHLAIPHPQVQNRRFALVPLNEIAPGLVHPGLKKTIRQLLADCADTLAVKKIAAKNV